MDFKQLLSLSRSKMLKMNSTYCINNFTSDYRKGVLVSNLINQIDSMISTSPNLFYVKVQNNADDSYLNFKHILEITEALKFNVDARNLYEQRQSHNANTTTCDQNKSQEDQEAEFRDVEEIPTEQIQETKESHASEDELSQSDEESVDSNYGNSNTSNESLDLERSINNLLYEDEVDPCINDNNNNNNNNNQTSPTSNNDNSTSFPSLYPSFFDNFPYDEPSDQIQSNLDPKLTLFDNAEFCRRNSNLFDDEIDNLECDGIFSLKRDIGDNHEDDCSASSKRIRRGAGY